MTETPRRELPPLPNIVRLRKEAKVGEMRQRIPMVRLADVQHVLAREYGFTNWAALKMEVERRAGSEAAMELRENRARGALHRAEGQHNIREEPEAHPPGHFLRLGITVIVVFALSALLVLALALLVAAGGRRP